MEIVALIAVGWLVWKFLTSPIKSISLLLKLTFLAVLGLIAVWLLMFGLMSL